LDAAFLPAVDLNIAFWGSNPLESDSGAVDDRGQANSPLFELARVPVCLDHFVVAMRRAKETESAA
jgi:hypothetical protein